MKKLSISLLLSLMLFATENSEGCTTFIINGRYTPDGRPVLYKHRDTGTLDNALVFFTDGKYSYIGLVNATEKCDSMVWGGYNSAGFAIMNSVAYNKNIGDTTSMDSQEGIIMKLALQNCATVDDFEKLLTELPKPLGVDTNFGVIDSQGGAAYFETGHQGFNKIDVNDPSIAPYGYVIRTNHAFTGPIDKGAGYIRYATANNALYMAAAMNMYDPQYLINNISRNLTHSLTGVNLWEDFPSESVQTDFRSFEDFIPRNSSASAILVRGVKKGEDPSNTMMWTVLGFPLVTVATPVWLAAGEPLPSILTIKDNFHAPLCDAAMKLKERCFPILRGSGAKYINIAAVINSEKTGIMQLLKPVEDEIFKKAKELDGRMTTEKQRIGLIRDYYKWLDKYLQETYKNLFGIVMDI